MAFIFGKSKMFELRCLDVAEKRDKRLPAKG